MGLSLDLTSRRALPPYGDLTISFLIFYLMGKLFISLFVVPINFFKDYFRSTVYSYFFNKNIPGKFFHCSAISLLTKWLLVTMCCGLNREQKDRKFRDLTTYCVFGPLYHVVVGNFFFFKDVTSITISLVGFWAGNEEEQPERVQQHRGAVRLLRRVEGSSSSCNGKSRRSPGCWRRARWRNPWSRWRWCCSLSLLAQSRPGSRTVKPVGKTGKEWQQPEPA